MPTARLTTPTAIATSRELKSSPLRRDSHSPSCATERSARPPRYSFEFSSSGAHICDGGRRRTAHLGALGASASVVADAHRAGAQHRPAVPRAVARRRRNRRPRRGAARVQAVAGRARDPAGVEARGRPRRLHLGAERCARRGARRRPRRLEGVPPPRVLALAAVADEGAAARARDRRGARALGAVDPDGAAHPPARHVLVRRHDSLLGECRGAAAALLQGAPPASPPPRRPAAPSHPSPRPSRRC